MKRLNVTIEDETYFEIIRNGLIQRQELSKTVNAFLKIYLETSSQYDKTISELNEEISILRTKHLNEVTKETKRIQDEDNARKQKRIRQNQILESIKVTGMMEDAL